MDRPDLAVGRDAAVLLGRELQVKSGLEPVAGAEQEAVVERPDLVVAVLPADERVEVVGLGRPADAQRELFAAGRRRGAGGEGRRQAYGQADG